MKVNAPFPDITMYYAGRRKTQIFRQNSGRSLRWN